MKYATLLIICASIFSGCSTIPNIDWSTQTTYKKVAVISALGEEVSIIKHRFTIMGTMDKVLVTQKVPNARIIKGIENSVIQFLEPCGVRATGISSQMEELDYSINIFPANPTLKKGKLCKDVEKLGYDLVIFIEGISAISGDHNMYKYDEMGVYRKTFMTKEDTDYAFVNYRLHIIDINRRKSIYKRSGLKKERSWVSTRNFADNKIPLRQQDWREIEQQTFLLATSEIKKSLSKVFKPSSL